MTPFIHLRLHTEYSLLEGAMRVSDLTSACKAHAMPAVAVTDTNNMFASLEVSEKLVKEGIQPIIGCQISLRLPESATPSKDKTIKRSDIVLLAQNAEGLNNLRKLNSCLYLGSEASESSDSGYPESLFPCVTLEQLGRYSAGLICLTGGASGPLGQMFLAGRETEARWLFSEFQTAFPDRLYVELQRHLVTQDGNGSVGTACLKLG